MFGKIRPATFTVLAIASTLLLTSCLDEATTSSNTDTPSLDNVPSSDQISANYTEKLDDSQIAADLAYLAWLGNHDYVAMKMSDSLDGNYYSADANGCYPASFKKDSTFIDEATTISIRLNRTKNGEPFQYCTEGLNTQDQYFALLSGSTTNTSTTIVSDSLTLQSQQSSTTYYSGNGNSSFTGPVQMQIRYALPAPAAIMASLEMSYNSASENPSISLKGKYWFFDGRYQCELNVSGESSDQQVDCDITHNGIVVGIFRTTNEDDSNVILDKNGNTIEPKLP